MKELDKTKKYNLAFLNNEQLESVRKEVLKDKHTSVFNEEMLKKDLNDGYSCIEFRNDNSWWIVPSDTNSINALELFDSKENSYPIKGKKESTGKCKFELDFEFIEAMSLRIENETKYEPYNWKLPLSTGELANALLRHAIEVKKGNFDDNGELGHLMAIANNAMFLYYQLKNNK